LKFKEVLARFENIKVVDYTKHQYSARCPAHDDKKNSLVIMEAMDGKALIHCHAGCILENILARVNLTQADLYPEKKEPQKKIAAEYLYTDASGKVVHKTIRYEPKGFSQARPDGQGGWVYNLKDIQTVLYQLPEVLLAVKEQKTIFIVEGEKDTDNLHKLGFVSTTNPMGAAKWKESYSECLKGADVVIIPDCDEAGTNHAKVVAASLKGKAKSVRILNLRKLMPTLTNKGDVSDYISAVGSEAKENILQLVSETPEWEAAPAVEVDTLCLSDIEVESVQWLWEPYIPSGKVTLVQGNPGEGKTSFVLAVAAIVTAGGSFPNNKGFDCLTTQNVIYQTAEDGLADTIKPRLLKAQADCSHIFVIDESKQSLTLLDERIEAAVVKHKPALLIIDPLQAYLGAEVDMHRANEVRPVLKQIGHMASRHGCAIILVMHLTKSNQNNALYRGLGSIDIPAAARSVLLVGSNPNNPEDRAILQIKNSLSKKGEGIAFEIHPEYGFCWKGTTALLPEAMLGAKSVEKSEKKVDKAAELLESMLGNGKQVSMQEIKKKAEESGISQKTLERAKFELNVKTQRIGFGRCGKTVWFLPQATLLDENIEQ
jgi:5S rRNA maturation endonuclease (ribonuclease M5)/KaiC/GvpD/RAD55 family RecA-like ATPase